MSALTAIGSRKGARRLMLISAGNYPLPARQEAIYALWRSQEIRAERLIIRLSEGCSQSDRFLLYTTVETGIP